MKCVIPGINIKVFGRAIHALSKIGDEIYVEPLEHGLALRTVNSSRSAYGCFMFSPTFFQHYDDGSGQIRSEDSEEDAIRCKVAMKSCLTVFKSMSTIEKTVERCKIKLNMDESRLVFQLYCKHGIVKTHNLAFIECETLQAVFSKDMSPNQLTAQAKLLSDAVVNFQSNQEEITLLISPEKISLKNYVDDEPDPNKVVHTVVHLAPEEFDNCQVGVDTDITFCLKELRAILGFAEALNMPLNIHFESAGRPVVFGVNSDTAFEANLVLATLADAQTQASSSQQQSTSVKAKPSQRVKTSNGIRRQSKTSEKGDNHSRVVDSRTERSDKSERLAAAYDAMMDDDFDDEMAISDMPTFHNGAKNSHDERDLPLNNGDARLHNLTSDSISNMNSGKNSMSNREESVITGKRTLFNPDRNKVDFGRMSPQPSTSHSGGWLNKSTHMVGPDDETQQSQSPVVPNQSKSFDTSAMDVTLQEEMKDDEEDFVPGTPPSKKFRSLFFGMSQASTNSQMSTQSTTKQKPAVLVEDSDED
ncbi:cell cycle checkpoint control protein RAD9A-like [Mytilus californianus]|uniref:cell cycle checkpoint control protein RAD9A-like n=1 Tax=Mytilus californianus TaxID=6549 RepID=UPI002246512D|nr:cell cycle checkpoint control protein RAD9A-like [Mytilus californianus]